MNKLKNANNAAYDANHTYGRWNGTGAVNMQIGTFTNTKDEYVYKTFYRVKDTTEWTEINTSDICPHYNIKTKAIPVTIPNVKCCFPVILSYL